MVYLTGDTHGELDRFKDGELRRAGKGDLVVVLGDFGFVWDGSKAERKNLDWLRKRPYTILFLLLRSVKSSQKPCHAPPNLLL